MAIGTLLAKIVLDNPRRIHYGSTEPVTGKIILTYTPSTKTRIESNPELFGPLQLAVNLHGRAKSKVWKRQGNNTHIYRGRAPLFRQSKRLYDDSFRARPNQPNDFPFELYFPEGASDIGGGDWEADGTYRYKPGDPLPPSFNTSYYGFSNRYESFVEYRVGVQVAMPRLQIIIAKPEKYDEALVYYERPMLHAAINETMQPRYGRESVKNEFLLPEADRPTGFRQKAKAAFSSDYYPTYAFDWFVTGPQHLYLGQPLVFEVRIKPREAECTAIVIPDVQLSYFSIEIRAITDVRAEKQIFTSPESHSNEVKATLKGVVDYAGPFSKANDWSKTINTRALSGLCSTFQTYNISQSYRMKIRGAFTLAGKTKEFDIEKAVTIHPPIETANDALWPPSSSAAAGSSSRPFGMGDVEAALPEYDRPPEYDEAVDETPLSAVQSEVGNKKEG